MKLAGTSILALALAAPVATAQTREDRPNASVSNPPKDSAAPSDKTQPRASTSTDSSTSDRGSPSTSSSATTSDRNVAASSDTSAKDDKCNCDCSQMGKMKSKKRASGRSATDSGQRSRPSDDVLGALLNERDALEHIGDVVDAALLH